MLWLLESGLVAIARLLLYLRLLGQVTNLFPQLTRRFSAGEPHARVRGPCAQFGGMGLEHVQQPLPVALVVPDALVVAKHALVGEDAAQPDDQMGAPLARLGVLPSHDALFARPELLHPALDVGHLLLEPTIHEGYAARAIERAGGVSERCEANREIRRSNGLLTAIRTELGRIFDRLGELFAAKIRQLRQRQARPEPAEPNWRYFEGDARRQLEADKADHTAAIRGKLMDARADVGNREEWWRSHGTEEHEAAKQIIDVARAASREARDANIFKRGRLLRNAEQVAGEQSERLRGAVPWLEDADIPADWDQANRFRMRTTKAIYDHDMQPRTRLVAELERRLEQAERAEGEKPSPEQVKALALRMAEQRAQAENPTQDTKRPAPSGDEPLDLSEPEDWGEASPFESRQAPRTKADLLNEIRQRTDRLTGQREAEQRQIDPWSAQPPQRRGHGR